MIIKSDLTKAAALLSAGELVAFPTETVYGLGADAANEAAIRHIFAVKERPLHHPLIVHVAHVDQIKDWARRIPPVVYTLAKAFWPGPLTVVLPKQPHVLDVVTGGQDTVGIRIPNHPIAIALLKAFGGGVVAPSANKFTHISPTTAQAVWEELGDQVSLILDGGPCSVGLESTILDLTGDHPVILRPGMIASRGIAAVLGYPVAASGSVVRMPGMHHLHYAPVTKTKLMTSIALPGFLETLAPEAFPVAVMSYSTKIVSSSSVHVVKMPAEAKAYAQGLYHTMRLLDGQQFNQIIIELPPEGKDWEAIRDRLYKATATK